MGGYEKNFLGAFLPSTKTSALKKEISSVQQGYDETLSAYWSRFKRLIEQCPNHKMSEGDLLQVFYQGMNYENKNLVNSSSGGRFSKMRVSEAKDLIQRLVEATCEYEDPQGRHRGVVVSSNTAALEARLDAKIGNLEKPLTTVVEKVGKKLTTEFVCGVCGKEDHATSYCREEGVEAIAQVNATGNWQPQGQKRDPYSFTYNPGWCDNPNFKYPNPNQGPPPPLPNPQPQNHPPQPQHQEGNHAYQPPHQRGFQGKNQGPNQPNHHQKPPKTLEEMMGDLIASQQFKQNNVQANNDVVHKLQDAQRE